MIENVLTAKGFSLRKKFGIKAGIAAALVLAAVALPQIVHLAMGAPGGVKWLPMYLPVLLCGCLLGAKWGVAVGAASPLVSFAFTSLVLGSPMPAAARLPFMAVELCVMAIVSGAFAGKIAKNPVYAFIAVAAAFLAGRTVFIALVALFGGVFGLTVTMVWSQILTGALGMGVQIVCLPILLIGLSALLKKRENDA